MDIEADRPELVVMGLAHFHSRHPEEDFARIEIAKNSPLELQEERRVKRIAQVEQRVRARQTLVQFAPRHSDAAHSVQVVRIIRRCLIKNAIASSQLMLTQLALKLSDARLIVSAVVSRGK